MSGRAAGGDGGGGGGDGGDGRAASVGVRVPRRSSGDARSMLSIESMRQHRAAQREWRSIVANANARAVITTLTDVPVTRLTASTVGAGVAELMTKAPAAALAQRRTRQWRRRRP